MASSGSADEDFQSRVDRIFGSLAFSRSSSSKHLLRCRHGKRNQARCGLSPTQKWRSGSGSESSSRRTIGKRCLVRHRSTRFSVSRGYQAMLGSHSNEDFDDEWIIRASMGLDPTLDDEEKEDEYDKVALGKEDGGEGLSMDDAISKPSGFRLRDPRANHVAAKIRLKEDELEASKFSPSKSNAQKNHPKLCNQNLY